MYFEIWNVLWWFNIWLDFLCAWKQRFQRPVFVVTSKMPNRHVPQINQATAELHRNCSSGKTTVKLTSTSHFSIEIFCIFGHIQTYFKNNFLALWVPTCILKCLECLANRKIDVKVNDKKNVDLGLKKILWNLKVPLKA